MHFFKILTLTALLAVSTYAPANAQSLFSTSTAIVDTTPVLPNPLTPEPTNALISRLSDTKVRALLLDQLHTQAVEVENTDGLNDFFYHATSGAAKSTALSISSLPVLFDRQP